MVMSDVATPGAVEEFISLPHGKVRYWSCGSGFPLLLIHGMGWGPWVWEHIIGALAEKYRVYAICLPGFHGSDRPVDWYRIEDLSEGIVTFMDALGIQKAHVVAQHGGSLISFDLAARHPERVEKLVLNSCPAWSREDGRKYHEVNWLPRQCTERGFKAPRTVEEVRRLIHNADQRTTDLWNKGTADIGWSFITHTAMGEYHMPARMGMVKAPTLLIYGEKEAGHLWEGVELLKSAIPHARFETVAGTGYAPPYENPEKFLNLVMDLLGS